MALEAKADAWVDFEAKAGAWVAFEAKAGAWVAFEAKAGAWVAFEAEVGVARAGEETGKGVSLTLFSSGTTTLAETTLE